MRQICAHNIFIDICNQFFICMYTKIDNPTSSYFLALALIAVDVYLSQEYGKLLLRIFILSGEGNCLYFSVMCHS